VIGAQNETPVVLGVALEDIATCATGVVQVSGYVYEAQTDGTVAFVHGDLLSAGAFGIAKKSGTNPFAIAKAGNSVAGMSLKPIILLPRPCST
jgi:hypothetical protein